jgi:multiple antibiotic resistance protein
MMGYDMLQARLTRTNVDANIKKQYINDISVTPLAIPMLCGPGAIANSIVLMEDASGWEMQLILISAIALVLLITYLSLLGAAKLTKFFGDTGTKIMMRLMGLIIMVIAVEFFFSGLKPIVRDILK